MRPLRVSILALTLGLACKPHRDSTLQSAAPHPAVRASGSGTPWAPSTAPGGHEDCNHDHQGKMTCCPDSSGEVTPPRPDAKLLAWNDARIRVVDKVTGKEDLILVRVGQTYPLTQSGLQLRIERILPAFRMGGHSVEATSDLPANPAAQVRILDGRREVFRGWLFARFPETHAFRHPRFAVRLVDLGQTEIGG